MNFLEMNPLSAALTESLWMQEGYKEIHRGSRKKHPAELPPSLNVRYKNWTQSFAPAIALTALPLTTHTTERSAFWAAVREPRSRKTPLDGPNLGIFTPFAIQLAHLPSMPASPSPAQLQRKSGFQFMIRILIGFIADVHDIVRYAFWNFFETIS